MRVHGVRTLEAEVCIIGAGPVGLTLARELGRSGVEAVLIESGGRFFGRAGRLDRGTVEAEPALVALHRSRARGMGGTARLWNTEVTGGMAARYAPFEDIDFETRAPLRDSSWPFGRGELDPYYERAHEHAALGAFEYQDGIDDGLQRLALADGLVNRMYRLGGAKRFTHDLPALLASDTAVRVVRGATVTDAFWSTAGTRVEGVRARARRMASEIRARRFVLAAGCIENARLLMLWLDGEEAGPPRPDWLGRGLTEHPVDRSVMLESPTAVLHEPSFYQPHGQHAAPLALMGRIGFEREALIQGQHLNAAIRLVPLSDPPTPHGGFTSYHVFIDLEQAPHYDNRVTLSDRRDPYGTPQAALHWRWRDQDETSRTRVRETVVRALERAGAGRVMSRAGTGLDPNAHHYSGTTRMNPDPSEGVVDTDLRVHGLENVFVAGSSIFPTAGCLNPTLTAIAIAIRLADHLTTGVSRA